MPETIVYILIIALTTFLVRALPFLFIRRPITNPRLKMFLDFVPFATLAAMAFPDMVFSTGNALSGFLGFLAVVAVAVLDGGLIKVAGAASLAVLIAELLL